MTAQQPLETPPDPVAAALVHGCVDWYDYSDQRPEPTRPTEHAQLLLRSSEIARIIRAGRP